MRLTDIWEEFELSVTKWSGFVAKRRQKTEKIIRKRALLYIKTLIFRKRYAKIYAIAVCIPYFVTLF